MTPQTHHLATENTTTPTMVDRDAAQGSFM